MSWQEKGTVEEKEGKERNGIKIKGLKRKRTGKED